MFSDFALQLLFTLDATLRLSAPLILCGMAGLLSERAGIIDISLEGKMLMSAFVAAAVATGLGNPWLALLCAIFASMLLGLLHGFACISLGGNQVISGLALNILASGLTVVIGIALFQQGGQTPYLGYDDRFGAIHLPGTETLQDIPLFGSIWSEFISGHNVLVWLSLLTVPLTGWILYKTRFGLRLRAVGELPEATETAGISVFWLRYRAVLLAGVFCGIAGAYLSIAQGAGFIREMSAGKGYIALAAMIFGKWRPLPTLFACLLFGFLEASTSRLQGIEFPWIGDMPVQFILALPYIMTVVLLAGFVGSAAAPKSLGRPYLKQG